MFLHLHSQEADHFMKVIAMSANIKFLDFFACFYYILNAPRCLNNSGSVAQVL